MLYLIRRSITLYSRIPVMNKDEIVVEFQYSLMRFVLWMTRCIDSVRNTEIGNKKITSVKLCWTFVYSSIM